LRVIPFELGIVIVAFHVTVQSGSDTVSPLFAAFIALRTSESEQLLAFTVAAVASEMRLRLTKLSNAIATMTDFLIDALSGRSSRWILSVEAMHS